MRRFGATHGMEKKMATDRTWFAFALAATLAAALAQAGRAAEDEALSGELPLENRLVGRDFAARLRVESLFTEDREDLIDENIEFARSPKRIYASELKLFCTNRATVS